MKNKRLAILFLSVVSVLSFAPQNFAINTNVAVSHKSQQIYWRTELYFGRDKNDGTQVSEEEWSKFLDEIVTPKFPDGLTALEAKGQYRLQNGTIVKENSKVLILLYTPKTRLVNSKKIDQIRNEYKKRFKQESVMRIDLRQTVKVSF